jgi:transposase
MKYRNVRPVGHRYLYTESILQRQFAAATFIRNLSSGINIINIDESSLRSTDNRKKSWGYLNKPLILSSARRLVSANIIAAISSNGEFYFTLNSGRNNSLTLLHFFVRLVRHFNLFRPRWRENTVFMLDNASYHKSEDIKKKFLELKLSVIYLGPYQFDMAPIENFFSYIKQRDLNILGNKVYSK